MHGENIFAYYIDILSSSLSLLYHPLLFLQKSVFSMLLWKNINFLNEELGYTDNFFPVTFLEGLYPFSSVHCYLWVSRRRQTHLAKFLCMTNGSIANGGLESSATFDFSSTDSASPLPPPSLPYFSLCCRAFEIGWGKINCEVLYHYCKMKSWRAL